MTKTGAYTAYEVFVHNGTVWLYAGTAWTLAAAQEVLATYAQRGYLGKYVAEERR